LRACPFQGYNYPAKNSVARSVGGNSGEPALERKEDGLGKIIYISGPSGMAKTIVKEKLERLAIPLGIRFERAIATMSREMRPHESQGNPWYFKSLAEIEADHIKNPQRYLKVEARQGELQGLDAETELKNKLDTAGVLWCELHIKWLEQIEEWLERKIPNTKIIKVFVAPLTEAEVLARMVEERTTWENVIQKEVLRRLMARRAANLDNASFQKLQERAHDAVQQYALRSQFDCVIVNHQGEESEEWGASSEFPTGEAARVLEQFLRIYSV
jgi:guanylate kinase